MYVQLAADVIVYDFTWKHLFVVNGKVREKTGRQKQGSFGC